jgi:hypothetical protein
MDIVTMMRSLHSFLVACLERKTQKSDSEMSDECQLLHCGRS